LRITVFVPRRSRVLRLSTLICSAEFPVIDLSKHPGILLDRLARTKQIVHVADLRDDTSYKGENKSATIVALVGRVGARTFISVPRLKEGELVDAINLYRPEVRPFTEKQIGLVASFASQAVIAIENARLLDDLNKLNQQLEQRVADQVGEIERMGRLRRFLAAGRRPDRRVWNRKAAGKPPPGDYGLVLRSAGLYRLLGKLGP
jgi:GAF domain-containing protein